MNRKVWEREKIREKEIQKRERGREE